MSGRGPDEIWEVGVEEGQRRLSRGTLGLAATGLVGGVDIMLGILALVVVSGAVDLVAPEGLAHVVGSLFFGIGLVSLVVGRSELFTENFLVPVSAVLRGAPVRDLARLWAVTLVFNLVGLAILSAIFVRAGLIPPEALEAAGHVSETFAERDFVAALLSAIVAGTVMTLFTWLTHAVEGDSARIAIAMLVGFLLAAPSLNHAVVSFGEMLFGIWAGTTQGVGYEDLARNFAVAVLGNLIGGFGFVTLARLIQARGEPG